MNPMYYSYSRADVSEALGISVPALESRLRRWRKENGEPYNLRDINDLVAFYNRSKKQQEAIT